MKRNVFLSLLLLLGCCPVFSQVQFTATSFDAALETSAKTGKMIFLQYESNDCDQCNEVADKGFKDKKLGERVNAIFITIKIGADHPDRKRIAALYDKGKDAFGTLFIAPDKTLLHSFLKTTSMSATYNEEIDEALNKASEGVRLSTLLREYQGGNRHPLFLEEIMALKKELNLDTDTLLNEYAELLPKDSFTSVRTLVFMAKMAPVIDSRADNVMRTSIRFNEAWRTITLKERISINFFIVYKSMNKAIRKKNETYAYRVSAYRKYTYDNDQRGGQKASDDQMIRYYLETKDTLNYLIRSVYYYDNYYMTISVDSIKKKDSLSYATMHEKQKKETPPQNGVHQQTFTFTPTTQYYGRELNNAASSFYDLTSDPLYIAKAIKWSERATQFFDNYIFMNTHAQLLYKAGKKEDAVTWQNKAIDAKKKAGYDTKKLDKELAEMKK